MTSTTLYKSIQHKTDSSIILKQVTYATAIQQQAHTHCMQNAFDANKREGQ